MLKLNLFNFGKKVDKPFEPYFKINLHQRLAVLPPLSDKRAIDVRYPLIEPYAYAHIYWDSARNELVYEVEEPQLDEAGKKLLRIVKVALEERISVSFISASRAEEVIAFLEKNVQSILTEISAKVDKDLYLKLVYHIYRDFVGLNKIEPLMKDYFIEDIECNGVNAHIYVVHRIYENLVTNVRFTHFDSLSTFVEKLAQKSGRYVSYARPLLDGTLPDGSRVNATYTTDVTTRGPTFTIRKFTKNPWTPLDLIRFNTASPEHFAFLWLAIEHQCNIMIAGETAAGKTTMLNSIMYFIPPEARVCSIEDTREINLAHSNWLPAVTRLGFGVPNASGQQYGEIDLFDLLKETFRQAPDYVVVGEVRGKEAYVLFQGMASGHPSFSTFHAGSVETLIQRLRTPPISLSSSLLSSLDVVVISAHVKGKSENIRRIVEIDEIETIDEDGKCSFNRKFTWQPASDRFEMAARSVAFEKIQNRTGLTIEALAAELQRRAELLRKLALGSAMNYKQFTSLINRYYKNPDLVIKEISGQKND